MLYFLHDFFTQLLYWGITAKKQGRCNWFASFMAMCFYKVKNWLGVSPWNGFAILFGKEIDLGLKSIT